MRMRSSVVTAFRCGTFATTTGSSASSAAARIGSVAFLAPEMRTSPSRGTPPWICSLSMLAVRGLFGRQCLDRQGVYLATHELAQRAVDHLVAGHALQLRDVFRVHGRDITWARRARAYNEAYGFAPGRRPHPQPDTRR